MGPSLSCFGNGITPFLVPWEAGIPRKSPRTFPPRKDEADEDQPLCLHLAEEGPLLPPHAGGPRVVGESWVDTQLLLVWLGALEAGTALPPSPPASLLAGCSILRSASSSSMNAGLVEEVALFTGESCCHHPASHRSCRSSGKCPQCQTSLVVGRKKGRRQEGDRGRSPLLRPMGMGGQRTESLSNQRGGTEGSHLPGATMTRELH